MPNHTSSGAPDTQPGPTPPGTTDVPPLPERSSLVRLAARSAAAGLTALVAVPLLGAAPAAAATPAPTITVAPVLTVSAVDAYENRLFYLTNQARTSRGLRPLVKSGCATTIAGSYAYRLAVLGRLVHNSMTRVASTCGASAAGENIAYGTISADRMFQLWMASPGHRANILRPEWKSMGMGAYKTMSGRWYGVQNFLRA